MELRTYYRAELKEIFKTNRTDSYTRSLKRAGYTFESAGRGDGYWIRITSLPVPPTPFEVFAKREFNCGPQTNFEGIQLHFFLLFYHPDYQFLPSNYQAKFIEENYHIKVSDQSLRNWQKFLIEKEWIAKDKENVKYVLCKKGIKPKEISEELYKKAWKEFYSRWGKGEDQAELRKEIYYKYDGMPRKQCGIAENGFYEAKLQELYHILEENSFI